MTIYEAIVEPFTLYVKIDKDDDVNIIRLGSSAFPDCASVHVYGHKKPVAELHGLIFNELCSSNIPLNKENKGAVKMVKAVIASTLKTFPHVTHFQLTDNSTIEYKPIDKYARLADMYFLLHGETWYEAKFGAYPIFFTMYERMKTAFGKKPSLPFGDVWKYMPKEMRDKVRIKAIYTQSANWHEFFQQWWEVAGCTPFLYIYSDDGNTLIHDIFPEMKTLYGSDWMIDVKDVDLSMVILKQLDDDKIPRIAWSRDKRPIHRMFGGMHLFSSDLVDV